MLESILNKKMSMLIGCILLSIALFPYLNYLGILFLWVGINAFYRSYKSAQKFEKGMSKKYVSPLPIFLIAFYLPVFGYILLLVLGYECFDDISLVHNTLEYWINSNGFLLAAVRDIVPTIHNHYNFISNYNNLEALFFSHIYMVVVISFFTSIIIALPSIIYTGKFFYKNYFSIKNIAQAIFAGGIGVSIMLYLGIIVGALVINFPIEHDAVRWAYTANDYKLKILYLLFFSIVSTGLLFFSMVIVVELYLYVLDCFSRRSR